MDLDVAAAPHEWARPITDENRVLVDEWTDLFDQARGVERRLARVLDLPTVVLPLFEELLDLDDAGIARLVINPTQRIRQGSQSKLGVRDDPHRRVVVAADLHRVDVHVDDGGARIWRMPGVRGHGIRPGADEKDDV